MIYKDFLKKIISCPFCEMTDRIYASNTSAYLTYAIAPYHKDHLLVVPKRHVESIFCLTKEEEKDIIRLITIGSKILKKMNYDSFTILVREGNSSGKSVKHVHYHLIPNSRIGDLDHIGRPRKILSKKEITNLSAKIEALII